MSKSTASIRTVNHYQAPEISLYPSAEGAVSGVCVLTDPYGEEVRDDDLKLSIGHSQDHIEIVATLHNPDPVIKANTGPDSPDLWTQDHLEFRFVNRGDQQTQIMFFLNGTFHCSDACDMANISYECETKGDAFVLQISVPKAGIKLQEAPVTGDLEFAGLVAAVKWQDGGPFIAATSALELGFTQRERFTRFLLKQAVPDIQLIEIEFPEKILRSGNNRCRLLFNNPSSDTQTGVLRLEYECAENALTTARGLSFPAGKSDHSLDISLDRPAFRHVTIELDLSGTVHTLCAFCLRAAVSPLPRSVTRQHPYLFCSDNDLELMREIAQEPATRQGFDLNFGPQTDARSLEPIPRVWFCLNRWILEPDRQFIDIATEAIPSIREHVSTIEYIDLHEGMLCQQIAMAYDCFAPLLDDATRRSWLDLAEDLLNLHLKTARIHHWNCTSIPNANAVCNGGAGLLALAVLNELPEKATETLYWSRKFIGKWLDYANGPQGGNTEGTQYWQYAMEYFLPFAIALQTVSGTDEGLLSGRVVKHISNMIKVSLSNDGCCHGFNDTIPMPLGGELAWFAGRYNNDRFARWYGNFSQDLYLKLHKQGRELPYFKTNFRSLIFKRGLEGSALQQPQPDLPEAFCLHDIEYGILRSGPEWNCKLTAGLKGSHPPYTHHNQADTGSFFIHVKGERLLIDPGYYIDAPTDHSIPSINGVMPSVPSQVTGQIIHCRQNAMCRYLCLDATRAYAGSGIIRFVRHLLIVGSDYVVLMDDIEPESHDPSTEVQSYFQAGGPTRQLDDKTILIKGGATALTMRCFYPGQAIRLHPEQDLHRTHWGYHFAVCRHFPVTVNYKTVENRPFFAVFTVSENEIRPDAGMVDCGADRCELTLGNSSSLQFVYLDKSGWILNERFDS